MKLTCLMTKLVVTSMLMIMALLAIACTSTKEPGYIQTSTLMTPTATVVITIPKNAEPPTFVKGFWPIEEISFSDYQSSLESLVPTNRGIGIGFLISDEEWESRETVSLSIDGNEISNDTLIVGTTSLGRHYLSWAPEIESGLHEVFFEFVAANGDVFEYRWFFAISEI